MADVVSLVLPKLGIIQNKLHKSLKLLNLHHALYILMRNAVILSTCHIVRMWMNNNNNNNNNDDDESEKNKIQAIGSLTVPVLRYSFGIINWHQKNGKN